MFTILGLAWGLSEVQPDTGTVSLVVGPDGWSAPKVGSSNTEPGSGIEAIEAVSGIQEVTHAHHRDARRSGGRKGHSENGRPPERPGVGHPYEDAAKPEESAESAASELQAPRQAREIPDWEPVPPRKESTQSLIQDDDDDEEEGDEEDGDEEEDDGDGGDDDVLEEGEEDEEEDDDDDDGDDDTSVMGHKHSAAGQEHRQKGKQCSGLDCEATYSGTEDCRNTNSCSGGEVECTIWNEILLGVCPRTGLTLKRDHKRSLSYEVLDHTKDKNFYDRADSWAHEQCPTWAGYQSGSLAAVDLPDQNDKGGQLSGYNCKKQGKKCCPQNLDYQKLDLCTEHNVPRFCSLRHGLMSPNSGEYKFMTGVDVMLEDDLYDYRKKNWKNGEIPIASVTMVKVEDGELRPLLWFENVGSAAADPFDILYAYYITDGKKEKGNPAFGVKKRSKQAHHLGWMKQFVGGEARMRETYTVVSGDKAARSDSESSIIYSIYPYMYKEYKSVYWVIERGPRDADKLILAGINPDEEHGERDEDDDEPVMKLGPVICKMHDDGDTKSGAGYNGICNDEQRKIIMRTSSMEVMAGGDPTLGAILNAIWTWSHPPTDEELEEEDDDDDDRQTAEKASALVLALGPLLAFFCD